MIVPVPITTVQVNQDNSLFVTTGVDYDNSGSIVGSEITAQYTLYPGDSLEGQPSEVVKIANALWTQEMIDARLAKMAAEKAAQEAAAKAAAEAQAKAEADAKAAATSVVAPTPDPVPPMLPMTSPELPAA